MKINKIKNVFDAFSYCLVCGAKIHHASENILKCSNCSYKHYVNSAPASGILLRNNQGEYLLTKRGIEPYKGAWDVAGGFIGLEESFEEAAARELEEELHVKATIEKIIGTAYLTYPYQNIELPVLAIIGLGNIGNQEIIVDDDVAEYKFFSLDELTTIEMPYPNLQQLIRTFAQKE